MALTNADFSATQSDADPSYVTFTDISGGTDLGLTARRISMALPNGTYLTASGVVSTLTYIDWPIGSTSLTVSVLPRSEAPTVVVDWMTGSTVSYTKTRKFDFDFADYIFSLGLTMDQVANNNITQDLNWYGNKMQLMVNLKDSETAITYFNDTTLAQNSLDRNYYLISNAGDFF